MKRSPPTFAGFLTESEWTLVRTSEPQKGKTQNKSDAHLQDCNTLPPFTELLSKSRPQRRLGSAQTTPAGIPEPGPLPWHPPPLPRRSSQGGLQSSRRPVPRRRKSDENI